MQDLGSLGRLWCPRVPPRAIQKSRNKHRELWSNLNTMWKPNITPKTILKTIQNAIQSSTPILLQDPGTPGPRFVDVYSNSGPQDPSPNYTFHSYLYVVQCLQPLSIDVPIEFPFGIIPTPCWHPQFNKTSPNIRAILGVVWGVILGAKG